MFFFSCEIEHQLNTQKPNKKAKQKPPTVFSQDPLSCMRAVKGPWADPEAGNLNQQEFGPEVNAIGLPPIWQQVLKCLDEHPLDKVPGSWEDSGKWEFKRSCCK